MAEAKVDEPEPPLPEVVNQQPEHKDVLMIMGDLAVKRAPQPYEPFANFYD